MVTKLVSATSNSSHQQSLAPIKSRRVLGKTVEWLQKHEKKGGISKIGAYALGILSAAVLSLTLVGISVVVLTAKEWKKLKKTQKNFKKLPQPAPIALSPPPEKPLASLVSIESSTPNSSKPITQLNSPPMILEAKEGKPKLFSKPPRLQPQLPKPIFMQQQPSLPESSAKLQGEFEDLLKGMQVELINEKISAHKTKSAPYGSLIIIKGGDGAYTFHKMYFPHLIKRAKLFDNSLKIKITVSADLQEAIKKLESWNSREGQVAYFKDQGQLVANKDAAVELLKEAPVGHFVMWPSIQKQGAFRFLQKLPCRDPSLKDVFTIEAGKNLFEEVRSLLSFEGQEKALRTAGLLVAKEVVEQKMNSGSLKGYLIYQHGGEYHYVEMVTIKKGVLFSPDKIGYFTSKFSSSDLFTNIQACLETLEKASKATPYEAPPKASKAARNQVLAKKSDKEILIEAKKEFLEVAAPEKSSSDVLFEELRAIYFKASRNRHPDKQSTDDDRFKLLSEKWTAVKVAAEATKVQFSDTKEGWALIDKWVKTH